MCVLNKDCDFSLMWHACSPEESKKASPPTTVLTLFLSSDLKFQLSIHCSLFYPNTTPTHQPLPDLVLWSQNATFTILRSREKSPRTLSCMLDLPWEGQYVAKNYHNQLTVNNKIKISAEERFYQQKKKNTFPMHWGRININLKNINSKSHLDTK